MFKTLRNAFKVKDIRDRILFTFLMLIIIGSEVNFRLRVLMGKCLNSGGQASLQTDLDFSMRLQVVLS